MDLGLAGRAAIVGGSSKGIGRACAESLARDGACVTIVSRHGDEAAEAAEAIERAYGAGRAIAVGGGGSATAERWGRVDISVNNLGGPPPGQAAAMSDEQWLAALDLSFMSAVRLDRLALPFMRKQGYGRIITVLSLSIKQPEENLALSTVARSAAAARARLLALEVAADGVTVNNVLPGSIKTGRLQAVAEMQARRRGADVGDAMELRRKLIAADRFGEPEEVGDLVAFLASERAGFITGQNISVDGGQLRAMV
ncbi:MAG: SDR family oxidoreductase [Chloroflexota bacterium]|nr:SDR family oxidoreductase [Chloroflexota bacterium]